jgi:hypothetical protein
MAKKRAGWERKIYRGTAGSTAATHIDANVIDIGMSNAPEYFEDTQRGDGTGPPKKSEQLVTLNKVPGPFSMIYKDGDANMAALLTAADAGTAVAIKIERHTGGITEFDGDCHLDYDSPAGLKEGAIVTFTLHPNDSLRDWT